MTPIHFLDDASHERNDITLASLWGVTVYSRNSKPRLVKYQGFGVLALRTNVERRKRGLTEQPVRRRERGST